jgi:superfamily I DNA/RNA helicase
VRTRLDLSPPAAAPTPDLDPAQQAVVDHRAGALLVLAGPGTGKTTTIVESIVARLDEGVIPAESILALTFGRRAAQELRDRVAARRGGGAMPQVATFHSFAYGLLRGAGSAEEYQDPPRLLSGAEEDARIRELIRGTVEDGSIDWPESIREALGTHGFASEVRTLIARIRERDLSPERLRELAASSGRPEWAAIADVAEQEQNVMVLENVLDYTELMRRAVITAHEPSVQYELHGRFRAIYVDEYQDTDPLQVKLLRAIAGPQCSVVAVGDPDQAIYAFRGADVGGITDFPRTFRNAEGEQAPIVALRNVRRYGPQIAQAAHAALKPAVLPGLPVDVQREHRNPLLARGAGSDAVELLSCSSRASRNAHIAEQLRAAHVHEGVRWPDMAVLARTSDDLGAIERVLRLAGVPAAVAADEQPLRAEPAVAHLLVALEVAADRRRARVEQVFDLLSGPMIRLEPAELRLLGRALREERRDAGTPVPPARELIADLVLRDQVGLLPATLEPTGAAATAVHRARQLLDDIGARIEAGAPLADILWSAWTGGAHPHGWPERLRQAALAGSDSADRDLDAVIALFDTAERINERYRGIYGIDAFVATLRDQAIPAESIAAAGAGSGKDRVPIMTVHRAKGLQWSRVWVAGLEEGSWPNLRLRGSLLGVQELEDSMDKDLVGVVDPIGKLVREERNLLYVACTRACDRLTLLCVDDAESGDDRPSRFVDDITRAGISLRNQPSQPDLIASWPALVADLRLALQDPACPEDVRAQAAALLAQASTWRDATGHQHVPAADPERWWGARGLSQGPVPLREDEASLALSGSSLDALLHCSMKWFLDHEVHAETVRGGSTAFGSIVHAIADHVAKGDVPEDIDAMDALVDHVWSTVEFEAPWKSGAERREARRSLERFLRYHLEGARELVETERYLQADVPVPLPDGTSVEVTVRGFLDRIERISRPRTQCRPSVRSTNMDSWGSTRCCCVSHRMLRRPTT